MEIKNLSAVVNAYRFNAESAADKNRRKESPSSVKNTDKAEFSSAARASFTETMKAAVKTASESSASPERISALKAAVKNGTYDIPAEDVAASILGF